MKTILQFRRRWDAPWLPFGLPHPLEEGIVRLAEVRVRMNDVEWRLVDLTTGGRIDDFTLYGTGRT